MRKVDTIVIHSSAGSQKASAADIVNYHLKNLKWSRPGYHFIVEPDGKVVNTWPVERISNGVKGHNEHIINVCYIGGIDANGKCIDNRTDAQKSALRSLVSDLKAKFGISKVVGHRDFSPDKNGNGIVDPWERIKECPCFDAIPEYRGV